MTPALPLRCLRCDATTTTHAPRRRGRWVEARCGCGERATVYLADDGTPRVDDGWLVPVREVTP